jgi:hypothetical protein
MDRQAGVHQTERRAEQTYYEPRCVDTNYGLEGLLHGRRVEELAFKEGRGPDPRTIDYLKSGFLLGDDPLR